MRVNVQGGTRAGWKQPLRDRPAGWTCGCRLLELVKSNGDPVVAFKEQPGYLVRCPECKQSRP